MTELNQMPACSKPLLPLVFSSVDEAVKLLKLDKRHKWWEFSGEVIRDGKYTTYCTGCDGGGCHECGYCGKRISYYPVPAIHPLTGNPVKLGVVFYIDSKKPSINQEILYKGNLGFSKANYSHFDGNIGWVTLFDGNIDCFEEWMLK